MQQQHTIPLLRRSDMIDYYRLPYNKGLRMKCFFLTGTGNRCRCIPISTIANNLGVEVSHYLPGFHAFTGNVIKSFSQIHRMCIPHRGTTQLPQQL